MLNAAIASGNTSRLIHVLFVIQLVSMGAMEMSGPFWPVHFRSLDASDFVFGIASVAVYVGPMVGIMLTSAFWGRIGDRFGHKLMMIRALLGLSLTQLALAYTTDIWLILALRFAQGAFAGYIAPAQAYGVSVELPSRRTRLFAYLQVSTNVGSLGGAIVGGLILDYATFFWINASASALCAVCALAAWLLLPNVPPSRKSVATEVEGNGNQQEARALVTWRSPPILGLVIITGVLLVSRMVTQTPFSLYVSSVFEVKNWLVGLCYGLLALGFILSAPMWARYFENKSLSETLRWIACIALICAGLTAVAGATRHIGIFIGAYFAWGLLLGATTPILTSLISKAAGNLNQGYILGVTYSTTQFSAITGIVLGGWWMQVAGLESTYFFVAFFYLVAAIAAYALGRRHTRRQSSGLTPEKYPVHSQET